MTNPEPDRPRGQGLRELVVSRLIELDTTAKAAARSANGAVSYETLRNIIRGVHGGRLSDTTAHGIAKAIQVPVARVYEAAGLPTPSGPWEWPKKFERLDPGERRLVEDVAAGLLGAREKGRQESV